MRCVCGHSDVSRHLSIEGIRDEISWVWDSIAYKAFLAMLTESRESGGLLLLQDQSCLHGKQGMQ
jgi:hypothetical protein